MIELVSSLLRFRSSLYTLDNSPLSNLSFANILSHLVAFHFLDTVFYRAEGFNFNEIWLILTPLMDCVFELYLNKYHHTQRHLGFLLNLSSWSFLVLYFTFRSVIHIELVFVEG